MKKIMALVLALILVVALVPMSVSARTLTAEEQQLFANLKAGVPINGTTYYIPADVMTQAENYVASTATELTAAQITTIQTKVDAAKATAAATGTGDTKRWTEATKNEILSDINAASQAIGLSAVANAAGGINVVDATNAVVVKNDVLIKTTGADAQAFVIAGFCGLAVLAACVFVSKKVKLF